MFSYHAHKSLRYKILNKSITLEVRIHIGLFRATKFAINGLYNDMWKVNVELHLGRQYRIGKNMEFSA